MRGIQSLPAFSLPTLWGRGEAEQVATSSDQGPRVNNSGREIVDFCFQAFGCRMQITYTPLDFFFFFFFAALFPVPGMTIETCTCK